MYMIIFEGIYMYTVRKSHVDSDGDGTLESLIEISVHRMSY